MRTMRAELRSSGTNFRPWHFVAFMNLMVLARDLNFVGLVGFFPGAISWIEAHLSGRVLRPTYCDSSLLLPNSFWFVGNSSLPIVSCCWTIYPAPVDLMVIPLNDVGLGAWGPFLTPKYLGGFFFICQDLCCP